MGNWLLGVVEHPESIRVSLAVRAQGTQLGLPCCPQLLGQWAEWPRLPAANRPWCSQTVSVCRDRQGVTWLLQPCCCTGMMLPQGMGCSLAGEGPVSL